MSADENLPAPFPDELPTVLQEDAQRSLQAAQDLVFACHAIDEACRPAVYELNLGDSRN
jgi:hypothetical protein